MTAINPMTTGTAYFSSWMKSILVPTDFSLGAKGAVAVAIAIANKADAHIYFLYVQHVLSTVSQVPHLGHYDPIAEDVERQAREQLDSLVKLANESGVPATPLLKHEKSGTLITELISPHIADIIVIGSHGTSGIMKIILGSFAQQVLRESPIPVIVVEKIPAQMEFKNIAFASTFKSDMSGQLSQVIELGKLWSAQINLLLVKMNDHTLDDEADMAKVKQLTKKFPGTSLTINSIGTNDEEWGIAQFAKLLPTDLIAINKKEFEGPLKMISPNKAEMLSSDTKVPVMVL
jgi:nucleotide-binding universal stress UspA family protein